jgi:antitoxin CptB
MLGQAELNKLKWRCRRGLLENDLFIARFFSHAASPRANSTMLMCATCSP